MPVTRMYDFASCLTRTADTPWGAVWLAASANGLCGLWFSGQAHFPESLPAPHQATTANSRHAAAQTHLDTAAHLLQDYIQGKSASPASNAAKQTLVFDLSAGTAFQQTVWQALLAIPYGAQCTYADLARAIGRAGAARAAGSAVAHNPISILIPCHRVVGQNGNLTGYAGGLARKQALLQHEAATRQKQHSQ